MMFSLHSTFLSFGSGMEYRSQSKPFSVLLLIWTVLLAISCTNSEEANTSPLVPCKLHDPNNGECLRDLWQNILIYGIHDIPGVKWISLDPYRVKRVRVSTNTPVVSLNMEFTEITIAGVVQSKITDVSVKNGKTFTLDMKIPKMHMEGDYAMDGRALVLNINGKGQFNIEAGDVELGFVVDTKPVKRDGEDFFEVQTLKTNVKRLGSLHMQFDNLFGGNQELTDSANAVFNQNWSELMELMRPVITEAIDASFLGQAKKYLNKLPGSRIFSDI